MLKSAHLNWGHKIEWLKATNVIRFALVAVNLLDFVHPIQTCWRLNPGINVCSSLCPNSNVLTSATAESGNKCWLLNFVPRFKCADVSNCWIREWMLTAWFCTIKLCPILLNFALEKVYTLSLLVLKAHDNVDGWEWSLQQKSVAVSGQVHCKFCACCKDSQSSFHQKCSWLYVCRWVYPHWSHLPHAQGGQSVKVNLYRLPTWSSYNTLLMVNISSSSPIAHLNCGRKLEQPKLSKDLHLWLLTAQFHAPNSNVMTSATAESGNKINVDCPLPIQMWWRQQLLSQGIYVDCSLPIQTFWHQQLLSQGIIQMCWRQQLLNQEMLRYGKRTGNGIGKLCLREVLWL